MFIVACQLGKKQVVNKSLKTLNVDRTQKQLKEKLSSVANGKDRRVTKKKVSKCSLMFAHKPEGDERWGRGRHPGVAHQPPRQRLTAPCCGSNLAQEAAKSFRLLGVPFRKLADATQTQICIIHTATSLPRMPG